MKSLGVDHRPAWVAANLNHTITFVKKVFVIRDLSDMAECYWAIIAETWYFCARLEIRIQLTAEGLKKMYSSLGLTPMTRISLNSY